MTAITDTPPARTAMVFAGEIFDGATSDHPLIRNTAGETFAVRVRAMPARHLGRILQLCIDEAATVEFVTQIAVVDPSTGVLAEWSAASADWVDTLDDASHVLLYEAAKRLNFIRAAAWAERQIAAKQFQGPLLMKANQALSPLMEQMVGLILSSLKSQGLLGAPSTKS
ncbi:hypothetical protein K0B96_06665 [Horticoccus luteus]|uniref:Uncharacterized protein n=1 Tax=Horticoccus luteus TaxID=2862869 RepID=A0A8F9TYF5_9BACT|nr:hypothetical protein [Horticoccus luteus]QYM80292.1 hypothetical protein K0B96_06665 [Horticoccus luteus]